jgi:predicted enzyme related to lactoylglutathione lyase
MPRVVHFEFYVDDPEQAVKFYQEVFGWKIAKWEGPVDYWLVTTGEEGQPGIDGAIARRTNGATTYNIIDVPSVDEFIEKIVNAGGKVVMPKQAVPGVGYSAYCADAGGFVFGLIEMDPSAQ